MRHPGSTNLSVDKTLVVAILQLPRPGRPDILVRLVAYCVPVRRDRSATPLPVGRAPARPTRRAVLLAGTVTPLAACAIFDTEPTATPAPHPDEMLRERVVLAEQQLVALYDSTTTEHPDLAERLGPYRARHEEHVTAVTATARPARPEVTPQPTARVERPPVSADPAEAIQALLDAEGDAAEARLAACLTSAGGELAKVLAGIAACEATHHRLLRGLPT